MGLIVASTTESAADIQAAMEHYGLKADVTTESAGFLGEEGSQEVTVTSKPEEKETPAEVVVETPKPESETEPVLETGKQTEQEDEWSEEDKARHKKLLKQNNKLTARAKTAEQDREDLRKEVEELRRKTELSTKETPVEVVQEPDVKRPERPARPKLAQFDYDTDAFEAANDKYESETLPTYEDARDKWNRDQAVREVREQDAKDAAIQAAEQAKVDWAKAVSEVEGLQEKLDTASDIPVSGAMDAVLRAAYTAKERAALTNYLIDNPDEAERIARASTVDTKKPTQADWLFVTNTATRELSRIEAKAFAAINKPTPVEKPKQSSPPPAKPKPPVSTAPTPIDPVSTRVTPASGNSLQEIADQALNDPTAAKRYADVRKRLIREARGG